MFDTKGAETVAMSMRRSGLIYPSPVDFDQECEAAHVL